MRPHHSCSERANSQALALWRGAWGVFPLPDFGSASRETPLFNYER